MLTLIPTPLNGSDSLHPKNLEILQKACANGSLILVEDAKATRSRWTSWGLAREKINDFIYLNEQTQDKLSQEICQKIKSGKHAVLISDEGMPAFCDPGTKLVNLCHESNIQVTSGVFANSLILGLALSGFDTDSFVFSGFPPKDKHGRKQWFEKFINEKRCSALMDTAYRLERVLSEVSEVSRESDMFLVASELNRENEVVKRGSIKDLCKHFAGSKRDFILVKKSRGPIKQKKK